MFYREGEPMSPEQAYEIARNPGIYSDSTRQTALFVLGKFVGTLINFVNQTKDFHYKAVQNGL